MGKEDQEEGTIMASKAGREQEMETRKLVELEKVAIVHRRKPKGKTCEEMRHQGTAQSNLGQEI